MMTTLVPLAQTKSKRVTLADIAERAGVSVATASVAITGRPSGNCRVSPAVAEKIRAVARELHYRPNLQARNLSTQRTRTIAVLIKRATWHNAAAYLSAAQQTIRSLGYEETIMLHPDDTLKSERDHLELCVERQVEGIIATPLIDLEGKANVELFNRVHQQDKIPIVQLGLALEGCVAPSVTADEIGGVRQAVTLLHAMGHRRIAHCTIVGYDDPAPLNPFRPAHLRYRGYQLAMRELNLPEQVFAPPQRCTDVTMLYESAWTLSRSIAQANPRPTAVIAFSDFVGAGLIAGLIDQNVPVPDEISILSIGAQPFTKLLRPTMSTILQQSEKMGEVASTMLMKMIDGAPGESTSLMPSLCLRESVREIAS